MFRPRRPQNLPPVREATPPSGVHATSRGLYDRAVQLARRAEGVSTRELAADAGVHVGRAGVVLDGLVASRVATVHGGRFYAGEPVELEGTGE